MTKPRKGQQPGRSFYHISYRNIDALEKGKRVHFMEKISTGNQKAEAFDVELL
jgi:hypothetical protein